MGRRGTSFGGLGFHYLDVSSDEEFDLVQGWGEGVGALTETDREAEKPKQKDRQTNATDDTDIHEHDDVDT